MMDLNMKSYYLLEGFVLTMVAAETGFIPGGWAWRLKLPFGMLAATAWYIVPLIFIAASIPFVRNKIGRLRHLVHIVAFLCIVLPLVVFGMQSRSIKLRDLPSREISMKLSEKYNGRIILLSNRGRTYAHVPRSFDQNEVARTIFELDATLNPDDPENGKRSIFDRK